MVYENVTRLGVFPMSTVVKVGDTLSDIGEGLNAGAWTVGVIKGSSELGLSEQEVLALEPSEWEWRRKKVSDRMKEAGAHYVIETIVELEDVIADINDRLNTQDQLLRGHTIHYPG